jgi:hypothetical protein
MSVVGCYKGLNMYLDKKKGEKYENSFKIDFEEISCKDWI